MKIFNKTRSDKEDIVMSKESKDSKKGNKYPKGPNEKQGYPDKEQPNKDNLHQDHMIEDNTKEKNRKKKLLSFLDPRDTFKGWTLIM